MNQSICGKSLRSAVSSPTQSVVFRIAKRFIARISQNLGIGYKKIERHLKEATGLTPQQFLKIRRFNTAVTSLYSGQYSSMTEVAYAAGYFDQAHCIRDFRSLTGQTPKHFLKSQFKIVEVIQPALADRLAKMWGNEF